MMIIQAVAMLSIAALTMMVLPAETKAPAFSLKTINGATMTLEKLRGNVVVLNFWATWCGPCRAEIPGFLDVYNRYKGKGVEIVGVSLDQGPASDVKTFVDRFKINYPVGIDDGTIADLYGGIQAIPTTFFIDRRGAIAERHIGFLSKLELEAIVKRIL